MIQHRINLKQFNEDKFELSDEGAITICTANRGLDALVTTNVFDELSRRQIVPNHAMNDLLHLAIGLYTVDQLISRKEFGFQGWSRYFKVFVPVKDLALWEEVRERFEDTLSFLSGDKWVLKFRKAPERDEQLTIVRDKNPAGIKKVALFSGGMDSFIGAIDELEAGDKIAFVSHHKRGSEGTAQVRLYQDLEKVYGIESFKQFRFWVQPVQKNYTSQERSCRIRSFLFFALGLTIANSLGDEVDFIIPENGLISLNVPLTGTRLSSHSTRTTHPFYIQKLREILQNLGVHNAIYNPYQMFTKGEMVLNCKNLKLLQQLNKYTLSCSHPDQSRRESGSRPGIHCGYCVPCIIRKAAEKKGKLEGTEYVKDIINNPISPSLQSGKDSRAFLLALERLKRRKESSVIFEILKSGPLFFSNGHFELSSYAEVYKKGMAEVEAFLKQIE